MTLAISGSCKAPQHFQVGKFLSRGCQQASLIYLNQQGRFVAPAVKDGGWDNRQLGLILSVCSARWPLLDDRRSQAILAVRQFGLQ
jgi:hypothetical protein